MTPFINCDGGSSGRWLLQLCMTLSTLMAMSSESRSQELIVGDSLLNFSRVYSTSQIVRIDTSEETDPPNYTYWLRDVRVASLVGTGKVIFEADTVTDWEFFYPCPDFDECHKEHNLLYNKLLVEYGSGDPD